MSRYIRFPLWLPFFLVFSLCSLSPPFPRHFFFSLSISLSVFISLPLPLYWVSKSSNRRIAAVNDFHRILYRFWGAGGKTRIQSFEAPI